MVQESNHKQPITKTWLIAILGVGVFSILNTEMGIIGILPMVAERYGIDIVKAGYLVSFFALGVAIAGPTMPLFCSRFNRKKIMLLVLAVFTFCNLVSVIAPSFNILLIARVVPAFLHPVYCALAFSVAAASVNEEDVPKAIAEINMGVAAGMVAGIPISNFLADTFSLASAFGFFALATGCVFLLTLLFVPDLPVSNSLSYGKQLCVLRKQSVWVAIITVILLNGSIFGVFNYMAEYLRRVTMLEGTLVTLLLFIYGIMNLLGSWLGGQLLAKSAAVTVILFPVLVLLLYGCIFLGAGTALYTMLLVLVLWGILGGINANINQYLLARVTREAPDFGNGLFLTAANVGCMAGTALSGWFIDSFGIAAVIVGGMLFAILGLVVIGVQYVGLVK